MTVVTSTNSLSICQPHISFKTRNPSFWQPLFNRPLQITFVKGTRNTAQGTFSLKKAEQRSSRTYIPPFLEQKITKGKD